MKTLFPIIAVALALTLNAAPPPQPVLEAQDLPKLGAADEGVLARLLPHIERRQEERLQRLAKEIEDYDPLNPPKAGDKAGFVLAGTAIAAAIGWLVKKIITAILVSILVAVLISWLKSYWWVPLVVLASYVLSTAVIARSVQRRA